MHFLGEQSGNKLKALDVAAGMIGKRGARKSAACCIFQVIGGLQTVIGFQGTNAVNIVRTEFVSAFVLLSFRIIRDLFCVVIGLGPR